ncbi:stage III sporulation AC/AD family protein [uncultured Subdoligranulum sp.]|uniref:stage III sporulation AC/AD family protein n=1 Tax=uncultured Subdoligranulum sp. TaxID=512298 RepID=UPI0025D9B2D9|nr:stage III sporulation AC/AD family protein [uncultured Subdoligranulum sp.]
MLVFKLAAMAFLAAVLSLSLKKEQPAYAFLISLCGAAGLLLIFAQQVTPVLTWLRTLENLLPGQGSGCLLRVLGIALVSQLAADLCKESGMAAGATAAELCGRILALLQAMPLVQELLGYFGSYLQ